MNKALTTILIVDDEPSICKLLLRKLSALGYDCSVVYDGYSALDKIKEQHYDVVLLDIKIPGISGKDILKEVADKVRQTIFIMVTGLNDTLIAVECMKLGAADYILKPFDLNCVHASISSALKSRRAGLISPVNPEEDPWLKAIRAVAHGIEVSLDSVDNHSQIVISRTIDTSRELGIPEEKILEWTNIQKNGHISDEAIIKKFEDNPLAQIMLGVTRPVAGKTDSNIDAN